MKSNECVWAIVNSKDEVLKVFQSGNSSYDAIAEARNYILDSIMETKLNDPEAVLPTEEAYRVIYAPIDGDGKLDIENALESIEL